MRTWIPALSLLLMLGCGGSSEAASGGGGSSHGTLTSGGQAPRRNHNVGPRFTHAVFPGEITDSDPIYEPADDSRHDRYPIQLQQGDHVRVSMWSTEFDTYLYLLGPDGEEVASDDDGTGSLNSYLEVQAEQSGNYTIIASTYSGEGRGQYALFVHSSDGELPGPLNVEHYDEEEYEEEYDAYEDARDPPIVDRTLSEALSDSDPTQDGGAHFRLFPVDLSAGDTVYVMMRSADFDTYLHLLDPAGQEIASSDDNEIAGGLNSYIVFTVNQAGTYQVRATSFSPGSTGPFELLIGRHPAGSPAPEP